MRFTSIDYRLALRYIAKNSKFDGEVTKLGMSKWCPVRAKTGGNRPGVTINKVEVDMWMESKVPNDGESRRNILGTVLELANWSSVRTITSA